VKSTVGTEDEALRNLLTLLVGVTVQLQSKLAQMFLHTAKRCHYSFNMKDLSVVFRWDSVSFIRLDICFLLHSFNCNRNYKN